MKRTDTPATPGRLYDEATFDVDGAPFPQPTPNGEPTTERIALNLSPLADSRKDRRPPLDRPGVWFCRCGAGFIGEAAGYPDDLRDHAIFRGGAAHDPGLARFRPDRAAEARATATPGLCSRCGYPDRPNHGCWGYGPARSASGETEP